MSYTTRCPACGTTFKVVPDQLKISDGWVRCGYCSDVFDASLYLQPWEEPRKDISQSKAGASAAVPDQGGVSAPAPEVAQRPRIPESQVAPPSVVAAMRQQAARSSGQTRAQVSASLPESAKEDKRPEPRAHSAAQFLSSPDAPAQPELSPQRIAAPLPPVSAKSATTGTVTKQAQRVADQAAELKPDPADDWGDSDFMAELKRYAEEIRAEDEAEAKKNAEADAQLAAEKAKEPPARAKPIALPPLPPVPSAFRPRPQRLLRDPRNERHASDDIHSALPPAEPVEEKVSPPPSARAGLPAIPVSGEREKSEKAEKTWKAPSSPLVPDLPREFVQTPPSSRAASAAKGEMVATEGKPRQIVEANGKELAGTATEKPVENNPKPARLVTPPANGSAAKTAPPRFESLRDSDFDDVDSDMPISALDDDEGGDDEGGKEADFASSRLPPARPSTKSKSKPGDLEDEVPLAEDDVSSRLLEEGVELSFVQQAKRKAFWESRVVRFSMVTLALLLSASLIGQWAIQERDALAASKPALRPLLVSACAVMGCELQAVRRIDQVVIERANLQRKLDNLYSFDFEIRNTSDIPLAAPAVELSLTGSQGSGQVIARRVFQPQEWPGRPEVVPAGKSLNVSLSLSLSGDQDLASAGFRAFVFYP